MLYSPTRATDKKISLCNASKYNSEILRAYDMAKAKTGSFYLTETITLPPAAANGTRVQGTVDLGAYVNVPTGQAIAVESVDFIIQRDGDFGSELGAFLAGNGGLSFQLTDLNPGTAFVRADDASLISSGSLNIDAANNVGTSRTDLYPDNFGPSALSEAFMVVNDTLYLNAGNDGAAVGTGDLYITARIKVRVVKLGTKDWMAIAIQSTASDN
jgi:hypothetical protein